MYKGETGITAVENEWVTAAKNGVVAQAVLCAKSHFSGQRVNSVVSLNECFRISGTLKYPDR